MISRAALIRAANLDDMEARPMTVGPVTWDARRFELVGISHSHHLTVLLAIRCGNDGGMLKPVH